MPDPRQPFVEAANLLHRNRLDYESNYGEFKANLRRLCVAFADALGHICNGERCVDEHCPAIATCRAALLHDCGLAEEETDAD